MADRPPRPAFEDADHPATTRPQLFSSAASPAAPTPPVDPTDGALLERARAGERHALEALLERYQAKVYRFGMKLCRDPEDAKDVLQETLLALARGVKELRGASSLSTWLYAVARSFCLKKRRRSKFHAEPDR
jgi:RNA polymerase sigma-70 factor (ECF subfamily)